MGFFDFFTRNGGNTKEYAELQQAEVKLDDYKNNPNSVTNEDLAAAKREEQKAQEAFDTVKAQRQARNENLNNAIDELVDAQAKFNPDEDEIAAAEAKVRAAKAGYDQEVNGNYSKDDHLVQRAADHKNSVPMNYKVKQGDTLSSIVREVNNRTNANTMTVEALAILNGIENLNNINTGQELVLVARKDDVASCAQKIKGWIIDVQAIKNDVNRALDEIDANISTIGSGFDNKINELRNMVNNNIETILQDGENFQKWMEQLSNALTEESNYADTALGNFGSNPVSSISPMM